ncbi:MAG: hypothetical protein H6610_01975 [Ignavibacteriales bacterium]|nr:hypothetical protein [Ignavibacteriales bacterium]MCB9260711.1 hypothetical protein [Ignavibacteriales bacterium]
MVIIEKDLFNFIFYPEHLAKDKYKYIASHKKTYDKEINLLLLIKKYLKEKISGELLNSILNRIDLKKKNSIVCLEKINTKNVLKSDHLVLAAASPQLEKIMRTETFRDKDSKYLIKIISDNEQNKVIIFNKDDLEIQNLKMQVEPSGDIFFIESTSNPIIIKPKQNIEKISLIH